MAVIAVSNFTNSKCPPSEYGSRVTPSSRHAHIFACSITPISADIPISAGRRPRLITSVASLFAAVAIIGCGDNTPPPKPPDPAVPHTIGDYVRVDSRFTELEAGLIEANLLGSLDEPGPLTLFAPTDAAVAALTRELGIDRLTDIDKLAELLRHHVVDGKFDIEQLKRLTALDTRAAADMHVRFGTSGIRLNDNTRVTAQSITADNGIIHIIDAVLTRPLQTTTTVYERAPNLDLEERSEANPSGVNRDTLTISDQGQIHDLRVSVDIAHGRVLDLSLFLVHEETNRFIRLAFPRSLAANIQTTFADSATFDAVADLSPSKEAFPENAYRPFEAFEFILGEPIGGRWSLVVVDRRRGELGTLRSWSMTATYGPSAPAPALGFARASEPTITFGRGFKETINTQVQRIAQVTSDLHVAANVGELTAHSARVNQETGFATLDFEVGQATVGNREVMLTAEAGDISRITFLSGRIVEPDRNGIDLLAHLPLSELGAPGGEGNDIWGWTDPMTSREYALVGTSINTTFVDITVPEAPVVLGHLPTHTDPSSWRDIKVYDNHAFIVSEADDHGMQVFDLTQLRGLTAPQTFAETGHNNDFGNAHNIVIDEASGFAYVVGATDNTFPLTCFGGLMMFDIQTPATPQFAGCFAGGVPVGKTPGPDFPNDVYIHDAQCIVYHGPDPDYQGHQLCISSDGQITNNNNYLAIADITDKANPIQIARATYDEFAGYAHQGWITDDHRYFILNDEFDEFLTGSNTVSYVWDLQDLDAPVMFSTITNPRDSVGHNTYIIGDRAYQANYTSGLRIIDIADIANASEMAYFDTHPEDDDDDESSALSLRSRARCQAQSKAAQSKAANAQAHLKEKLPELAGPIGLPHHPKSGESGCGAASFQGAWSNYPFFASGVIVISDINRGLFIVRPSASP